MEEEQVQEPKQFYSTCLDQITQLKLAGLLQLMTMEATNLLQPVEMLIQEVTARQTTSTLKNICSTLAEVAAVAVVYVSIP